MNPKTRNAIIALIIIIALSTGIKVAIKIDEKINTEEYNLIIRVESDQKFTSADFKIYFDGELKEEWKMNSDYYYEFTYLYQVDKRDPVRTMIITATMTSHGIPERTANDMITLGNAKNIQLKIVV